MSKVLFNVSRSAWLIILFIALRTINQIFFKKLALGPGGVSYFALSAEPLFCLTCMMFFAQVVVWQFVLKKFTLSFVYPLTSLTFITIMISGTIFWDESLTFANVLGAFIIILGVTVLAQDKTLADETRQNL